MSAESRAERQTRKGRIDIDDTTVPPNLIRSARRESASF
jgi:hypothetical protein